MAKEMTAHDQVDDLLFILAVCLFIFGACVSFPSCAHADCKGLTPEIQKAYDKLKSEGFNVTCEQGRTI